MRASAFRRGERFGAYVVAGEPFTRRGRRVVPCKCNCGKLALVQAANLRSGHSTRCRSCSAAENNRTHGETKAGRGSAEYRVWNQMIGRCHRTSHKRFADYGGRGIVVCDRWRKSLSNFIADMGRRPTPDHQIERKDNDGPYCKDNCVWATRTEQGRNKRNNVMLTFRGRTQPMSAWAEELGIDYSKLRRRIRIHGWSVERALTAA